MANNYANGIPVDERGNEMQGLPPPVPASITTVISTATSSTMSFGPNTTDIEVASPNGAVAIKWITIGNTNASVFTGVGTANFDHIIPAAAYRKFVLPRETQGAATGQAGSIHGLYQRIAVAPVNGGVASILITEY